MAFREDAVALQASGSGSDDGGTSTSTGLLPSRWVAAALSGQRSSSIRNANAEASSLWKKKWAGMRLVDTVKLDDSGEVESWVFTAKTGHVTSKKRAQDRAKIAERFDSFALANPRNTERFVALLTSTRPRVGEYPEERVVLDQTALREAILLAGSSQEMPQELLGATLQCYLRPQNGSNSFLRACYHCQGEGPPSYSLHRISPLYRVPDSVDGLAVAEGAEVPRSESVVEGDDQESVRLRSETEEVLGSLVAFLTARFSCEVGNEGQQQKILKCKADFVVDDNGELWLTSLPSVTVPTTPGIGPPNPSILSSELSTFPSSDDTTHLREERQGGIDGGKGDGVGVSSPSSVYMPPLLGNTPVVPQIAAPLDGSGSTPLGSARRQPTSARSNGQSIAEDASVQLASNEGSSMTGELPAIPSTMLGPRSASGDHNSRSRGKEGEGERAPIIEKKGGVYVANVHSSALRGLCCWRERQVDRRGSASHGRDSPRWQLVEARYKGNLASEEHRADGSDAGNANAVLEGTSSPASFDELSKARFKMTARSVLLARVVESFLWGEEPLHIGADDRKHGNRVKGGSGDNCSLSQRWREYDHQAQLSLASANPQAYYDEVTVCGNCMEICRKLDSIRASGFPDPVGAALTGGATTTGATWSSGDASSLSGEPALRPRSEPLPECILATTVHEGRPGTAATGRDSAAATMAADSSRPDPPGEGVVRGGNTTHEGRDAAVMEGDTRRDGDLEGSQKVRPNENVDSSGTSLEEPTPKRSGGEVSTSAGPKPEKDVDITEGGNEEAVLVGATRTARSGNEKASPERLEKRNTAKATMERVSSVYGEGTKTGGRNHSKSGGGNKSKKGTSRKTGDGGGAFGGELPNVATIARFAIERERLAREMGVDELGGPATLGVVNVGVAAAAHGRRQNDGNLHDEAGATGSKRAKNQQRGRGRGGDVDGRSGVGDHGMGDITVSPLPASSGALGGEKIAGETLLDRLESVAEARSIESAGGVHGGGGSRSEEYIKHDDWRHNAEEEASLYRDPARKNGPRVAGGEAAWDPAPPPLAAELSTTESAFLERSRRHVGLDGGGAAASGFRGGDDSLFGNHFEAGFRNESGGVDGSGGSGGGRGDGGGGGHVATIGALRDRLATVEGENAALRARARRAEEERATEAARGDRASKKLAQARTEFSRAMSEKDEDYRRRELALEERHSRELAKKSQTSAEEMMRGVSGSGEESEGAGVGQGGDRKAVAPGAMERKSTKARK
ncbi:unnamed protein product [Ectocarpus fasciculatus]